MSPMTTQSNSANVTIQNDTAETLLAVRVLHKYSDTSFKEELAWEATDTSAGITSFPAKAVRYNTGWFTTGRDWWIVTWSDAQGNFYVTAPENLRGFMDSLEKAGQGIAALMLGVGGTAAVGGIEPISKTLGVAIAGTGLIINAFTNSESTAGFKQHILRDEDANRTTTIVLTKTKVTFKSNSGNSSTGVKQVAALNTV